jgi:acyl-CoA synthetase (AMP-forming)/AMP-acid ligase II
MQTLADLIARNARLHGDRLAVVNEGRRYTHREHAERIWRLANALAGEGLKPGERIAVLSQNRSEYLELYGAAEAAGFILATLNWRLAPPEILKIVNDCTPAVLAFEAQYAAVVEQLLPQLTVRPRLVCIGGEGGQAPQAALDYETLLARGEPMPPAHRPAPEDIAHLVYTSGTTGLPKGAMLSHRALVHSSAAIACGTGIRPTDITLVCMPLFHVGAKIEWLAVQYQGGAIFLMRQFDPDTIFKTIAKERITLAHFAPVMVKTLTEHPDRTRYDLSSLAHVHYGSAPVPVEELRRATAAFGSIFIQVYGMTEHLTSSVLLPYQQKIDGDERDLARLASAGQPYPDTEARIVDDDGNDLPAGRVGELWIRSPGLMSGYWGNPALTAQAMGDGWMRTGDMGSLDADEYLYIVDRKKDMIISGGENIYSLEVEDALLAYPSVAEVAVIGVPDPKWGESVKAFVVLRPGTDADEAVLVAHCRARIASYKKPRSIEFVTALPRLAHGKVDKKALRAPYWKDQSRQIA